MGKWANLPLDLLYVIEDYVSLYIDKVRFRALSLEWNSYLPKLPYHNANQIHFLLHSLDDDDDDDDDEEEEEEEATHGLFNPIDNMVYKLYVPELNGKLLKGSSYGWIIATEVIDPGLDDIYLINPITRTQVKLPPRREFSNGGTFKLLPSRPGIVHYRSVPNITSDYEFDHLSERFTLNEYHMKILLSSDPSNNECVVVATFGFGDIAWCRCEDEKWTHVRCAGSSKFLDIVYSRGYLYGLTKEGRVIMFENIGTEHEVKSKEITTDREPIPVIGSAYLGECSDGSLIVVAHRFVCKTNQGQDLICTKEFKVYKIVSSPDLSWVEVKSIDDDVLFVGFGSVRTVPSTSLAGFQKNHVYFYDFARLVTDRRNKNVKSYLGLFSLENGTVGTLLSCDFSWPRAIWTNIATAVENTRKNGEIRMDLVDEAGKGRCGGGEDGDSVAKNGDCRRKRAHFEEEEGRKTKILKRV